MNVTFHKLSYLMACCAALLLLSACVKKVEAPEGPPKPAWTMSNYDKFDPETFTSHIPANTRINTRFMDFPLLNAAVFYETNRQRMLNGLKPFEHSPALEKAAQEHSQDMVDLNFFSTDSPQEGRQNLKERVAKIGIDNATLGENLAIGFVLEYEAGKSVFTPKQNKGYFSYKHKGKPIPNHTYLSAARAVVGFWMTAQGNRAHFLNPDLTYLGVGGALFTENEVWEKLKFTQIFSSEKGKE